MSWKKVGGWLKDNSKGLLGVVGAVATGNVPGGVAMAASMLTEATGETDPVLALEKLRADPQCLIKLEQIAMSREQGVRDHHEKMLQFELEDHQKEHEQTQKTIRSGDNADDPYVRHTRPLMARQSWWATIAYIIGMELIKAFNTGVTSGADPILAGILIGPAAAYMGFRTADKWSKAKHSKGIVDLIKKNH